MMSHYIWAAIAIRRCIAVGAINMRSTAVQCQVQYNNNFDTTTATLRRIEECWHEK